MLCVGLPKSRSSLFAAVWLAAGCGAQGSRFALLGAWGGSDAGRNEEAEVLRQRVPQDVVCGLAEHPIQSEIRVVLNIRTGRAAACPVLFSFTLVVKGAIVRCCEFLDSFVKGL